MSEQTCPRCGAEEHDPRWSSVFKVYVCGSREKINDLVGEIEGDQCLRNQLAAVTKERDDYKTIINSDGSLSSVDEHIDILSDAMAALDKIGGVVEIEAEITRLLGLLGEAKDELICLRMAINSGSTLNESGRKALDDLIARIRREGC